MARDQAGAPNRATYDDPRWLAAHRQLHEMKRKRAEIEDQIRHEWERRERVRAGEGRMAAALAILEGREPEPVAEDKEVSKMRREVMILADAEELAEKQLLEVASRVSSEIIARVQPEYLELLKRMHASAAALVALVQEEERFTSELEAGGTQFQGLTRIVWPQATPEILERYRKEAFDYYGLKL
jgi:hypothetical protein